ncbi:MAG TPA: hypothetical protein VFK36_04160, partial [Gemmatimonadales bacterium]|nr:hypothetical protein [Gemmatimonadales bacterium]
MRPSLSTAVLLAGMLAAQPLTAQSSNPVADAFRHNAGQAGKNLVAALETMPADKFGYKPTPAQMSVGQIANHLAEGNDYFCGT